MTTSSSLTITAADAVLWTALSPAVRTLPTPIPAGLCELPLARLSRYDAKPDPRTGRLPEDEWLHIHRLRALTGQWYGVRIAGDAQLGLPRAGDWPVLMAVMRLFEEAGWHGNALADVSLRRVLATMGVTGGGKMIRRAREALVRFSQIRVVVVPIAPTADPAETLARLPDERARPAGGTALLTGGEGAGPWIAPALWSVAAVGPVRGRGRRRGAEGGADESPELPAAGLATGVLDVTWREDSIDRITIAEAWRPRTGNTPTAWIDYDRYFALRDPVAQRLYQLFAGAIARGEAAPWDHQIEWLRSALGLSPRFKRSRVLEYISDAIDELRSAEILGDVTFDRPGRAAERLIAMPGPVMEAASLFAGLSLDVPRDVRVQLAVLHRLGVHRAEAARVLAADPAQTYEVLCYVLYALRHEPETIRDPGPYVRKAIVEGYRFAKPAYLRWRAGLQRESIQLFAASEPAAGPPRELPATEPVAVGAPGEAPPPADHRARFVFDDADPDAAALWDAVADELRRRAEPRQLRLLWVTTQLHHVAGARIVDGALLCATPDHALRSWMGTEPGRSMLADVVGALTAGAVTQVVGRVPGDVERPVLGPGEEGAVVGG